jgi:hypothetical protein
LKDKTLTSAENRAAKIDALIDDFLFHCLNLSSERDLFHAIYTLFRGSSLISDSWVKEKDFCFKKYFLERQLIRSDFDLNPKDDSLGISIDDFFCLNFIINPIKKDIIEKNFYEWIDIEKIKSETYKMCVIEEVEKSLVIDKLLAVGIATSMGMTREQNEVELIDYDRILRRVSVNISKKCV